MTSSVVKHEDFKAQLECYGYIDKREWTKALITASSISKELLRAPAFDNLEWAFVKNWMDQPVKPKPLSPKDRDKFTEIIQHFLVKDSWNAELSSKEIKNDEFRRVVQGAFILSSSSFFMEEDGYPEDVLPDPPKKKISKAALRPASKGMVSKKATGEEVPSKIPMGT